MGSTLTLAAQWLRSYVVNGVPASGFNNPSKTDGIGVFVDADAISGAGNTASDTADAVTVASGDLLVMQVVASASAAGTTGFSATVGFGVQ
jgi:hypothetical protein